MSPELGAEQEREIRLTLLGGARMLDTAHKLSAHRDDELLPRPLPLDA